MVHLVGLLEDLFQLIDIDATGALTYTEFTSYCVEAARQKTNGTKHCAPDLQYSYKKTKVDGLGSLPSLPPHLLAPRLPFPPPAPRPPHPHTFCQSRRVFPVHQQRRLKDAPALSRLVSVPEHDSGVTFVRQSLVTAETLDSETLEFTSQVSVVYARNQDLSGNTRLRPGLSSPQVNISLESSPL